MDQMITLALFDLFMIGIAALIFFTVYLSEKKRLNQDVVSANAKERALL